MIPTGFKRVQLGEKELNKSVETAWSWAINRSMTVPLTNNALCDYSLNLESVHRLRDARAFTDAAPASSRLPFSYHKIPTSVRQFAAHIFGRMRRRTLTSEVFFPSWPIDLSVDFLSDLVSPETNPFRGPPTPVILSHDIDSAEGLTNLVKYFLPLEDAVGAQSYNFIVPCKWPLDEVLLQTIADQGHGIGIHGFDHSNRTPFASPAERRQRIDAARPLIEKFKIAGYRAPSLCRTEALLADLANCYRFDSSIPSSGGLFPTPGNGCATARPYHSGHGNLIELPLSMPRDGSLRFLGHSPAEILALWKSCAADIAASGGVVVLLTHCEEVFSGNAEMLDVYRSFLEWIAESPDHVWSTPGAVLNRFENHEAPLLRPYE